MPYLDQESAVLPEGFVEAVAQVAVGVHVVVLAVQTQTTRVSVNLRYKGHLGGRPSHVQCPVCRPGRCPKLGWHQHCGKLQG